MSKYRVQAIIFVLVAFMLGCNEFIVVGILSDMAKSFGAPVATMGYLVTIFATTYAICTPFVTILTSKFSRYKTLLTLIVIFLIGNTLSGFATSFITMMLARMLTATVAGAIISLIMTFASAIAPRNKRASLVSWIFAGFSIASVFGVPLGTTISMTYGWRYTFFCHFGDYDHYACPFDFYLATQSRTGVELSCGPVDALEGPTHLHCRFSGALYGGSNVRLLHLHSAAADHRTWLQHS